MSTTMGTETASNKAERIKQAITLIRLIARKRNHQKAYIALTELMPSGHAKKIRQHFFVANKEGIALAAKRAVQLSDENLSELYIRCSLLKQKPPKDGRGTKQHTLGANVLWVDIDPKGQTLDEIHEGLSTFQPGPSLIVSSGNGIHAYWRLQNLEQSFDAIERRNNWIASVVGGDKCFDITHVLRVPGTHNYKDPMNPKPVRVLAKEKGSYGLDDFKELDTKPNIQKDSNITPEEIPSDFLDKLSDRLRTRIVDGPTKGEDRSANDWHIVTTLLRYGYTPGQVLTVLTEADFAVSDKTGQRGVDYAIRTIQSALERLATGLDSDRRTYLLTPILDDVVFTFDKKGNRKKQTIHHDADLFEPAYEHLVNEGFRFYTTSDKSQGFIVTPEGQTLTTGNNDVYKLWIQNISGFTEASKEFKILRDGLSGQAKSNGIQISQRAYCSLVQGTRGWEFRLLPSPSARHNIRVSQDDTISEVNGSGGQLHFMEGHLEPIVFNPKADIGRGLQRFLDLFSANLAVSEAHRAILTYYVLMVPLASNDTIYTKPILHLTGPSGGGKSQTLSMISTFLRGHRKLLNATSAAVYRIASKNILIPFDDYEGLSETFRQLFLTNATGITRIKSDGTDTGTVEQEAHTLFALTSTTELVEETVRRRAIVIDVNKDKHPIKGYHEATWMQLAEERSYIWSAYILWLHHNVLPALNRTTVGEMYLNAEEQIEQGIFKGLAGFLAWMEVIAKELRKVVPSAPSTSIGDWIRPLKLDDLTEISERNPLITSIHQLFEAVTNELGIENDDWEIIRGLGYVVRPTPTDETPSGFFGIEGTTTEWLTSLGVASRNTYKPKSPRSLGNGFSQLSNNPELAEKDKTPWTSELIDVHGFLFQKLRRYGPGSNNAGWRVFKKTESNDDNR